MSATKEQSYGAHRNTIYQKIVTLSVYSDCDDDDNIGGSNWRNGSVETLSKRANYCM